MKVQIVDFFPTEAGAEAGVFYFNRHKKMAILYRNGNQEVYSAILPNVGQPGSRFQDSDGDGIPDIREASMYDLQDIGWTPASGSTFNKPAYTSVGGITINATQVAISSLDNPLNVLFNGSPNTIRINRALQDGAIQRHNNTWDTFVQNQTIDIHNGDYLIYDTFIDSDGDGTSDSQDAFPNDPNEDTDIDGDGVGANTDVDDLDSNRASGNDDDGDGIDNEFDNDPNDGPLGDIDNDGIINSQDVFPSDSTNTKYDQRLVWNEMAGPLTTTGGPYGLSASTDSGETISFSIVSGPGTINGNILSPSSPGAVVIQASAPGNAQYNPASVNKSFNILDATTDSDGDGIPDLTDTDDDNDGVVDTIDNYPNNPNRASGNDNDGDGIDDEFDDDDDNDGVLDINDAFPFDPNESADADQDNIGDNADTDDDDDGIPDVQDADHPSNTNAPDSDGDGIIDAYDPTDNRLASYIWLGVYDGEGNQPYDPTSMPQQTVDVSETFDFNTIAKLRITNSGGDRYQTFYDIDENLTFNIANGQTISSVNNGVLSFSAGGSVDLQISFPGNTSYLPAATRTFRFTVEQLVAQNSFLGIRPVLIQGTPVADFNQEYNHVGGRLPDWAAISNLSTTGGQMGWNGFSAPSGGWPVYQGVQNPNVYIMKWGDSGWMLGYRGVELWSNTPPSGYNHLYPVDRDLAYVAVGGGTDTEEIQEATQRGGWYYLPNGTSNNNWNNERVDNIPITATLL